MEKTLITKALWFIAKTVFSALIKRVDNKLGMEDMISMENRYNDRG